MRFLILVLLIFSAPDLTFGQFDFDGKPGLKPKLFAAGIVSSDNDSEFGITFDRNSNAAYFTRREKGKPQKIYVTDLPAASGLRQKSLRSRPTATKHRLSRPTTELCISARPDRFPTAFQREISI